MSKRAKPDKAERVAKAEGDTPKADTSPNVWQRDKLNWKLNIRERTDLTARQKEVLALMEDKRTNILFLNGPAGSSKTYLAVLAALRQLNRGAQSDVIYIRSIIESASKSLGSLPGSADEKLQPFIMPLADKLEELLPKPDADRLMKDHRVTGMPVNYVRGASWNARFVIVDECQNLSLPEVITVLTRIGRFSKLILLADPFQSDLNGRSGFMPLFDLFNDQSSQAEGIHCVSLTKADVVRSGILRYMLERIESAPGLKAAPKPH